MIPQLSNQKACRLALSHRLFVAGWTLNEYLHHGVKDDGGVQHAAVYMDGDTPIAVALVTRFNDIHVFVRKSRRREGVGSKLVAHMKQCMGDMVSKLDAGIGLQRGSQQFWDANKVKLWDC